MTMNQCTPFCQCSNFWLQKICLWSSSPLLGWF
jgi:hypothetical protein